MKFYKAAWLLSVVLLVVVHPGAAQVNDEPPLFLVDEETTVRSISFRFDSTQTFEESLLLTQTATTAPGFFDRLKKVLPLMEPVPHPFSPLELQRDVSRLRLFYQENGFPYVRIGYAPSRLDTARNTIRIVYTINEGPPVRVRSMDFFSLTGDPFPDPGEEGWETFRDALELRVGDRYEQFRLLQTRTQTLDWLRERGYAFATLRDSVTVDTTALAADLRFVVDPGPVAYFDEVDVEGNERVSQGVIARELPFKPGQRFSGRKLTEGQREVFGLNLFRIALTDMPEQPRDSTVMVLVRVREGKQQLVTYRLGYDREAGGRVEVDHTHRNFFGAARTLTTTVVANSGFGATPSGGRLPARLFRATVALRQPYLFSTKLSATVAPFIEFERDQQLEDSDKRLGINTQELGLTTTLLYEVLPFRTVSLQHTFSRATLFTDPTSAGPAEDRFNRSILTLSGTFGKSDNYLSPERGVLYRPMVEMAGQVLGSDLQYYKASNEVTAYTPLSDRAGLAGRLIVGQIWPVGDSEDQDDPVVENRFDPIRFYAGGSNDVRGWGDRLAGPKIVRTDVVAGDTVYSYEAVGGLTKLALNTELRLPFPGLGENWGTALFFDAGRVSDGNLGLDSFRYGTGVGMRYRTPIGFLRLDLAYKLNPDAADLREAEDFFFEGEAAEAKALRRFKLHLSIGQTY